MTTINKYKWCTREKKPFATSYPPKERAKSGTNKKRKHPSEWRKMNARTIRRIIYYWHFCILHTVWRDAAMCRHNYYLLFHQIFFLTANVWKIPIPNSFVSEVARRRWQWSWRISSESRGKSWQYYHYFNNKRTDKFGIFRWTCGITDAMALPVMFVWWAKSESDLWLV